MFTYTVSDKDPEHEKSSYSTLTITIKGTDDDNQPDAKDDALCLDPKPTPTVNVVIIFDRSGSMTLPMSMVPGETHLSYAQDAVAALLGASNINNVLVVDFANNTATSGWEADPNDAITYVNGLTASGQTNYDAALARAQLEMGVAPPTAADQTLVYFVSDGGPNRPFGSVGVSQLEENNWEAFLDLNNVDKAFSVAIDANIVEGLGPNFDSPDDFVDIAHDGNADTGNEDPATLIELKIAADIANLTATIPTSAPAMGSGNVLDGTLSDMLMPDDLGDLPTMITKIDVGADLGDIYLAADDADGKIVVTTDAGGTLTFYFKDHVGDSRDAGDFDYTAPDGADTTFTDSFTYMIAENDTPSDMDTATVSITICEDGIKIM